MAIRPIVEVPDPRLREISKPVEAVDADVRALVADMFETMYAAPGIGLAAIQVGVPQRILVIDLQEPASDEEGAPPVRDPRRDDKMLCVVEEVADLWALDRSRLFPGRYHVLGGRLSALEGVRPEDLTVDQLLRRVSAGGIDEVVLAMNATLEGQTTAHYLAERLAEFPVRLSQLAHGLPVGGELDYLDEGTLAQALRARRPIT